MMKIRHRILGLTLICLAPASAVHADSLSTLFPFKATITIENPGLNRLELPADVVKPCRSDLADLRILNASGGEIPFLLDSPQTSDSALEIQHSSTPEVISAKRSRHAVDDRVTSYREEFILALPPVPEGTAAWDLILETTQPEFVGRVTINDLDADGRKRVLLEDGAFFRLPESGAGKNRFTIADRKIRRLELILESLDQGYLKPRFTLEARRLLPQDGGQGADLEIIEIRQLPTSSEVVVSRPRGLVPRRLHLVTATGTFHRKITVWDEGPGADPESLGSKAILRIDAIAPVEDLEIPLRPARGDRLRVVIDNQDSPPLESLRMTALVPRPILIFSPPRGDTEATLVFGGGRAHRPRYDLFSLEGRNDLPTTGQAATRALALLDPSRASAATLGPVEPNPLYDATPALSFAMHPGAPIDARFYSHRRRIEVHPSPEGLASVQINPEDLAILRADLADLRIVDDQARQWAYLRQNHSRIIDLPLRQVSHTVKDHWSHFVFEIPDPPMTVNHLQILTDAPYFDRDYRIRATLDSGQERDLARGRLHRRLGDPRPVRLQCPLTRITRLELIINDGDDAPLDLRTVNARIPVPNLYLAAQPGTYDVLMGFPEAEPPHYELEKIRSTVLAVSAASVTSGALEDNPLYSAARRLSGAAGMQKLILWAVLGFAVIVLVLMTLRMARQEQ